MIDNFYLLSQILIEEPQELRSCLKKIADFVVSVDENEFKIDSLNMDAIFNDKLLLKELIKAFLEILIQNG